MGSSTPALLVAAALLVSATPARGAKVKPKPAAAPAAPAAPAEAAPTTTSAAPAPELKGVDTMELMRRARTLQAELEYDQVLPLVREVLSRDPAVDIALDAYVLEGSCLAIVGDAVDAEQPFRRLLRGRPDFELPADTPPKIMGVFRKVQAEERAIVDQLKQLQRARLIQEMALVGEHPAAAKGGRPINFNYELKDPSLSASMRVQYRKKGEPAYSSLALQRDNGGRWRGQIPGEWTANEGGAAMEFHVESFDKDGALLTAGSSDAPLVAALEAGAVDRSSPPPLPPWAVFVSGGATVALALGGGGVGLGMMAVQQQYTEQGDLAVSEPQPGSELNEKRDLGVALATTANGLFIASGVVALATVVAGVFFTDWEGRAAQEEAEQQAAPVEGAAAAAR
jgi:hypothetical protein